MKTLKNIKQYIEKTINTLILITITLGALTIYTNSQANEYTNIIENEIVFDWKKPKKDMPHSDQVIFDWKKPKKDMP
jgi:hypothetical protein